MKGLKIQVNQISTSVYGKTKESGKKATNSGDWYLAKAKTSKINISSYAKAFHQT